MVDDEYKEEDFIGENSEEVETNPLVEKAETSLTKYYASELNKLVNNYPKEKSLYICLMYSCFYFAKVKGNFFLH